MADYNYAIYLLGYFSHSLKGASLDGGISICQSSSVSLLHFFTSWSRPEALVGLERYRTPVFRVKFRQAGDRDSMTALLLLKIDTDISLANKIHNHIPGCPGSPLRPG